MVSGYYRETESVSKLVSMRNNNISLTTQDNGKPFPAKPLVTYKLKKQYERRYEIIQ